MSLSFLEGNQAIARGAVAAGCRFFAGYPITPATTIFNTVLELLPPAGGICLQGEDEIASIGFCLGASMAGLKVMTATSGPGISLYSEQISFAIGSEIPIVIVDVQRLGPSTGSATKGADGDIQFMRWGNSSGLPVIVLSPVDVRDCFTLTVHAFNLAEKFRCPVFIAANKEISMTKESIEINSLKMPETENRVYGSPHSNSGTFLPFHVNDDNKVPDFLPIGGEIIVRQTSSTHGHDGYITTDPDQIKKTQIRLKQKLESNIKNFSFFDEIMAKYSDTLIITYGVTARAAAEAVKSLNSTGKPVSLLILKTLWPVPEELIIKKARHFDRIVVVEMNLGQYVREIERIVPNKNIDFLGIMNGSLITPDQIKEAVNNHG